MSLNLDVHDSRAHGERGKSGDRAQRPVDTLRKRGDFVAAARGLRESRPGFTLQARRRADNEEPGLLRVGFTCSRKVGNAVARNRAKRRLREVARRVLPEHGRFGWDYVMIGRPRITAERLLSLMYQDLVDALAAIHNPSRAP